MLYIGSKHAVPEVAAVYPALPLSTFWVLFWMLLAFEMSYLKLYFGMGFVALFKHKPRVYNWFSNVALLGIVVQVLFSYMNKANLIVFSFRLVSYVYSRFMRGLLQEISLWQRSTLDV
ncbi:unnamed protein product [Polarella glacialis]|uniref:Uncharacterized protein n=1 Tax=Polarella glacialis TaxID=89957 RepID=A0A813K5E0_POLGL|nr:unnamed protein product [Polarella glacialis]CAE8697447.1 unnamed protein product [Polarella glacialis]